MKKLLLMMFLAAVILLPLTAQTIPGAPGYQLPVTVVMQKWYGAGAPTAALNYPVQPGDHYYDSTNKVLYYCAAPVSATISILGGSPACTSVTPGGWTLIPGSAGPSGTAISTQPAGASTFLDTGTINLTLAQLQTLNSVGITILPAPGATSMYEMGSCTLNLTFGSAAFTGGGTVTIGYGTTSSPATNGTIASTVFTTFTASHGVVVLPVAVAVTATTLLANKAIVMTATGSDFAAGTGATGQIDCGYRILTGVS